MKEVSREFIHQVKKYCSDSGYKIQMSAPGSENFTAFKDVTLDSGNKVYIKVTTRWVHPKNYVVEVSMNCRMSVSCGLSEWIEVRRCITDIDTLKWWEVEVGVLHSAGYYFMS